MLLVCVITFKKEKQEWLLKGMAVYSYYNIVPQSEM